MNILRVISFSIKRNIMTLNLLIKYIFKINWYDISFWISPISTQGDEHKIFEWFAASLLQMTVVVWCNLSCIMVWLLEIYMHKMYIFCRYNIILIITKRYVIKCNSKLTSHKPMKDTAFVDMKNKVTCYWGISHAG